MVTRAANFAPKHIFLVANFCPFVLTRRSQLANAEEVLFMASAATAADRLPLILSRWLHFRV